MIKKLLITLAAIPMLTGCAGFNLNEEFTPERCMNAIVRLQTVKEVAMFLASRGIEAERATRFAQYIEQGQVSIQAVCNAVINPQSPNAQTTPLGRNGV